MEQLPLDASLVVREARNLVSYGADIRGPGDIYRFSLWRRWDPDKPQVLFIGHNPSTAAAIAEDPTTRRWRKFAESWGFGGYEAVNLYPYRSPTVSLCYAWRDAKLPAENGATPIEVATAMGNNLAEIRDAAALCARVVLCWGDLARDEHVITSTLQAVFFAGHETVDVFDLTQSGNPKHPMARGRSRVPDDIQPRVLTRIDALKLGLQK